jgi:extracellular factor (EF) 3-hydroxypalmitic acid methyl ester biosynthesis protein
MIDPEFKTIFRELESGHMEWRERLNALSPRDVDFYNRLKEELHQFEPWRFRVMDSLGALLAPDHDGQKEKYQRYVRGTRYFEIIQEAPFYWRIINKPNGYAGDAYMMHFIYRNQYEGTTPFGMFLHKHACETQACVAVRNRKNFLKGQIMRIGGGKVLSLAAGPAEEIREILDDRELAEKYDFLALDHDMDALMTFNAACENHRFKYALANAFQIISGNYMMAKPRNFAKRYCFPRKDFQGWRRALSAAKYELKNLEINQFDLVYSSGLYDYIETFPLDDTKGTVALTRHLFGMVKPGGALIVGNFSHNNPRDLKFCMEYVYDWQLIYRGREEMLHFARAIPAGQIASIEVMEEPAGINYFLKIVKKGA